MLAPMQEAKGETRTGVDPGVYLILRFHNRAKGALPKQFQFLPIFFPSAVVFGFGRNSKVIASLR